MYKHVDFLNKYYSKVSWYDIYYGLIHNFLAVESVSEYARKCLEKDDINDNELELAINEGDEELIMERVKKLISFEDDVYMSNMILAELKWKYCSIKEALEKSDDNKTLFNKINLIYSDFNYPLDMESFISYLPTNDGYNPQKHSREENESRLKKNIKVYLDNVKEILDCQNN